MHAIYQTLTIQSCDTQRERPASIMSYPCFSESFVPWLKKSSLDDVAPWIVVARARVVES